MRIHTHLIPAVAVLMTVALIAALHGAVAVAPEGQLPSAPEGPVALTALY